MRFFMNDKRNKVYIFGAGSSNDFGFPLENGIFSEAEKALSYGRLKGRS
jgi:hypothetical protein